MFDRLVHFIVLSLALTTAVHGVPIRVQKRIAQTTIDSIKPWEDACTAAGGADKCNPIAVDAASKLLAAAGPCEQQNAADSMIDLAKTLNNDPDMIKFAQIFAQQPRNTPESIAVPYCHQAPKNTELNGLFQCQFQGANQQKFAGGAALGNEGTIPFGQDAPLNPPGSCPAHPDGPIPDGEQLVDLVQDPGVGNAGSGTSSGNGSNNTGVGSGTDNPGNGTGGGIAATPVVAPPAQTSSTPTSGGGTSSDSGSGGDFKKQNGIDAQKQNAQFATLSASSSCTAGENACVNGGFAQCVGGSFVIQPCNSGLQCFALPLVNSPGTSLACTTDTDAAARIAAAGATGDSGVTSSGSADIPSPSSSDVALKIRA